MEEFNHLDGQSQFYSTPNTPVNFRLAALGNGMISDVAAVYTEAHLREYSN